MRYLQVKWILLLMGLFASTVSIGQQTAQPAAQLPPYKQFPTLPPLELQLPDSSKFLKTDLKKQETIIMYFSPDCDHCIHQMDDMKKRMKDLQPYQIILVTYQPMDLLVGFIKKYNLASYPNIKAGRDIKFALPGFYQIKALPYFALYDKKGNLVNTYESNTKVDKLIGSFTHK
ncbi:MAG: redoxin domain-containing protein [Chitinophagaceae bacterium]|nr:redoxin domain-containing protein [Chitinophagaceae bacterium]